MIEEDTGEEPDTCLDGVSGHWFEVTYGIAPYRIHAVDCPTCELSVKSSGEGK